MVRPLTWLGMNGVLSTPRWYDKTLAISGMQPEIHLEELSLKIVEWNLAIFTSASQMFP